MILDRTKDADTVHRPEWSHLPKAWLIGGGLFIAALAVVSIVVAIMPGETSPSLDTPEGQVQRFLSSLDDGDLEMAYESLSEELRERCPVETVFGRFPGIESRLAGDRITLEGTTTVGDIVFVDVRITRIDSVRLFGPSEFSHVQRYSLRQEGGDWRLVEYPWSLPGCDLTKPAVQLLPSTDR